MELEITRTIVLGVLCIVFFVGCMLATIRALDFYERYRHVWHANQRLLKENISLKAKLNCIGFYANEEKENKKVGKK